MNQNKVLTLTRITYTYPSSSEAVLRNISATFSTDWTGIIGNNGCGKSTLARIACNVLQPDCGSYTLKLTHAYCEQDAGIEPPLLYDFACDYSNDAQKLRALLNIEDDMLWRFDELSAGEQKKIQIATAYGQIRNYLYSMNQPTTLTHHADLK